MRFPLIVSLLAGIFSIVDGLQSNIDGPPMNPNDPYIIILTAVSQFMAAIRSHNTTEISSFLLDQFVFFGCKKHYYKDTFPGFLYNFPDSKEINIESKNPEFIYEGATLRYNLEVLDYFEHWPVTIQVHMNRTTEESKEGSGSKRPWLFWHGRIVNCPPSNVQGLIKIAG